MIHTGDCIEVMRTMPADSVDAVVTDPPYGLEFMGRSWDTFGSGEAQSRAVATFTEDGMGKGFKALPSYLGGLNPRCKTCRKSQRGGSPCQCEKPDFTNEILPRVVAFQAWCQQWATEALRVTRPGGYLLAFGGTRTHHRLVCGLEDAGWIIRDELTWVYACLSDDTEILTRRGWLRYDEMSTNDDALAFDPPSGSLQWEPIEAVHQYHHEGDMVRLVGDGTDQLVTLNHRLVLVDGPGVDQVPGVRDGVLAALRPPSEVEGPGVFEPLQRNEALARPAVQDREAVGVAARERSVSTAEDDRPAQPSLEGRRYHLSEARELLWRAVRSSAGVGAPDGPQGWLHHGAPPTNGRHVRLPDDQDRSGEPRESRPNRQPPRESDALADEPGPQAVRVEPAGDGWRLVPSGPVSAAIVGYAGVVWCVTVPSGAFVARRNGVAFVTGNSGFPKGKANLKPAHEPIVLARKPGPLRPLGIDAGRISTNGEVVTAGLSDPANRTGEVQVFGERTLSDRDRFQQAQRESLERTNTLGRWPSNVLLSDPALFDEPNPAIIGSGATAGAHGGDGEFRQHTWMDGPTLQHIERSEGGYSRFFLVPKSSRADREPVVRGTLEPGMVGGRNRADGRQWDIPGSTLDNNKPKRENTHPTCKPTDLLAHLIRLVCPPDGVILDPFLGSGSTAVAAEREGVKWIGIEKEPEYVAIAEARLNGTQRGLGLDVAIVGKPRKSVDGVAVRHNSGGNTFGGDTPNPPMLDMSYRRPRPAPGRPESIPAGLFDGELTVEEPVA